MLYLKVHAVGVEPYPIESRQDLVEAVEQGVRAGWRQA
jgi:hypothetical protein